MSFDIADFLVDLACDCCGVRDEELILRKPGALSRALFTVVRCRRCGFVYINPRLSEEGNARLYDEAYYRGEGFDSHVDYLADYGKPDDGDKIFQPLRIARGFAAYRAPPGRVLDFGCGLGDLMRQARSLGYAVEGYEVSVFARDFARGQGFTVHDALHRIPPDSYDLVSAVEVLEHSFRPSVTVAAIHRALRPGGFFVYTTLNIDRFMIPYRLGLAKDHDYITPEGHINFFNRRVMKRYLRQAEFTALAPSFDPLVGRPRRLKLAVKRALRCFTLPSARK